MAAQTVDDYLASVGPDLRPIAEELRRIILAELPDSTEAIKWSQPTYQVAGHHVAYIRATKKHVTLGFTHGRRLHDPEGRLEGGGQQMAHVKLTEVNEIDEEQFRGWLREARALAL